MSFIVKDGTSIINAKLTSIGRKLLASGSLTFSGWAFGDTEIDYTENNIDDDNIELSQTAIGSPKDKNPNIRYFITETDTSSNINQLPAVIPVEAKIFNTAEPRGFFSSDTISSTPTFFINEDYVKQPHIEVELSSVVGTSTLNLLQAPEYGSNTNEPAIGDYLLINWVNENITGVTTLGTINRDIPTPYLWYKIENLTGTLSSNTLAVTLDRPAPDFTGTSAGADIIRAYTFPYGNSIAEYYTKEDAFVSFWSENTLSFNGSCNLTNDNVPVWNMSIVWNESYIGSQSTNEPYVNYSTFIYKGQRVKYDLNVPCFGLIHYSNKSFSNYYGESFRRNTLKLFLPTIMWHNNTDGRMGLVLSCGAEAKLDAGLNATFYDLVDETNFVVGRCYPDDKIVIITNTDLLAAMSYKSNRNWTLPEPVADVVESFGGVSVQDRAFINPNTQTCYVSYMFESDTDDFGVNGYGLQNYFPYTMYKVADNRTNANFSFLSFNISPSRLPFLRSQAQLTSGTGWHATRFYVLVQVRDIGLAPQPNQWKKIDITNRLIGFNTWQNTVIPSTAFSTTQPIIIDKALFDAAPLFNINDNIQLPLNNEVDKLQLGDEVFFFGTVTTDIEAITYKAKFTLFANFNQFNTSSNPTWEQGQPVAISEVGIYSVNDELVAVGKFANPVEKTNASPKVMRLNIDF